MNENENLVPKRRFKEFTNTGTWEQRKLGEHSQILAGGTPKTQIKEYWEPKEIPWMSSGEINKKRLFATDNQISKLGFESSSARWVKENSVLIALAGQGKTRGTVAINEIPLTTNQSIAAIEPDDKLDSEFLFQNLEKRYEELRLASSGDGSRGGLNKQIISDIKIIAPSVKEQSKVGLFFKHLDDTIALHQRKLEKSKALKSAYLSEMFPAEGERKPKRRFAGFTDDWEQRKLGDVSPLRGGYAFQSEKFRSQGVPIIRISNILSDGNIGGNYAFYDEQETDDKYSLPDGAALLAMSGATTGKVAILSNPDNTKFYQNQRVGYFSDLKIVNYDFVSTIVKSNLFISQLSSVLVAGAQPNVSSKEIDSFGFYFPKTLKEQTKIGTFFKHLDNTIALHQRKLDLLKEQKKGFLQKMFV